MKWRPGIQLGEMESYREFFPRLNHSRALRTVVWFLKRLERVVGFPIQVALPEELSPYAGNQEALRALRIMGQLRERGIIHAFYTNQHDTSGEPTSFVTMVRLSDADGFGMSGKGAHLSDSAKTLWPALGEGLERWAIRHPDVSPDEIKKCSWKELPGSKSDIFNIAGFSEAKKQAGHPRYQFVYDEDTVFAWVKVKKLVGDGSIWAPLQWFSFKYVTDHVRTPREAPQTKCEPLLSPAVTTGSAAGQTTKQAVFRGLCEVVERDAFMIYWLNQMAAKRINSASLNQERFQELLSLIERYRLELQILYLETDVPIHTISVFIIDRSGKGSALSVSAKTGTNLEDIIYDTLQDQLAQRGYHQRMMQEKRENIVQTDTEINHAGRMHLWFQPERLSLLEPYLTGPLVDVSSLPSYEDYSDSEAENLPVLLRFFKEKQYEVFYRELLNPEVRSITEGVSSVMVKAPAMIPLYLDESLRAVGGKRLCEVAAYLGHPVDEEKEDPFSTVPHPFP